MRYLIPVLLAVLTPLVAAAADPLAEARQKLQRGNYAAARTAFAELAKDAKLAPRAAIGTAAAWRAEGESARALLALDDALKAAPADPDLLANRADLLYSLGKWDDALKAAEAVIAAHEKHFLARWVRARILRDKGSTDAADKEIRWFVREYSAAAQAEQDIKDPELLLIVGQAATENARWHNLAAQFKFVLQEVYGDVLKFDPDRWQAEDLAGRMLLEKHNQPEALAAFEKALKINPRAADALVGKGLVARDRFDLPEAERLADEALKVNPRHPEALRLKADVHLIGAGTRTAEALLGSAKAVNSRDEATLARLAACALLGRKQAAFDTILKDVSAFDTKPAAFYHELAGCLEDRKQFAKAEEFYGKAAELRPNVPGPKARLGMLLLRLGREAEAGSLLEAAFKVDPFDVRVSNSLKVLRHLDTYKAVQTPHFVLKFDAKTDDTLAPFLADYLEQAHADLKKQFGYEPPGKLIVEVFRTREMFSGRAVAMPNLPDAAAGACSGRVIAIPSPRAEDGRPYNVARVLRHELVHAFNLLQTNHQVPHWLTEGLAVRNEGTTRPPAWVQVLRDRLAEDRLFELDTITLGFVRPKTVDDWPQAYFQALLYVEYVTRKYGDAAIGKLLAAYREGTDTPAALKQALGVEVEDFEAGYRKFLEEVAAGGTKRRVEKPQTFAELEAGYKKNPADLDLAARLAGEYLRRDRLDEARKLADAILAKEKEHAAAAVVKARLLLRDKDPAGARAVLEQAEKAHPDEPRVLLALGRLYLDEKDYERAAVLYERGRKVAPLAADWLTELARIYAVLKKNPELAAVLAEVAGRNPEDLAVRVQLARVCLAAGKFAEAERAAHEALLMDVMNPDARGLLVAALKAQKKDAEVATIEGRFKP